MTDTVVKDGSTGIGILGFIGLLFVTFKLLKITEVANWGWLWVLAPFWVPIALVLAIIIIGIIIVVIAVAISALINK